MNTIAEHTLDAAVKLQREVFLLQAVNAELTDQLAFHRHMADSQALVIELQNQRIDLLEGALRPLGKRGRARLRRSPWWLRAWRRTARVAG